MTIWKPFDKLRRRNKVLFTIIVATAVILFWKGTWSLLDIIVDGWLFREHLFWANAFSMALGLGILVLSGLVLEKLV